MSEMDNSVQKFNPNEVSTGSVYVMTHSLFSNVIRIGCTPDVPEEHAKKLSIKTPGNYTLVFAQQCENPCSVRKQVSYFLQAKKYVNEFYEVPPEVAVNLLRRETLRIPIVPA
ncbi:GIY-YIG nuclease family protein [Thalassotalea atypica]|uniref:GIY-YIG nuclease family protein n=1 Tax=Thalassotalea atypica TaxID=2054316 RepID=UPI0025733BBC|nr:GIY-YIG nuclease family protein [Thalassotalea atypica]